jgi:phosphohistidine phosphatase
MTMYVTLVRHAHAEWPMYVGKDFDRPLTPRGIEDAAATAQAIARLPTRPQCLLASPAKRSATTAELIAKALALPAEALRYVDALYNARPAALLQAIEEHRAGATEIIVVAHNPGISELARQLAEGNVVNFSFRPAQWHRLPVRQS